MKNIANDIKNNSFRTAYLLYGTEDYLRLQYRDRLIKALVNEGDTMNYSIFRGKDVNSKEIIDLAETLPFLAERRVILVEDSGFFKSGDDSMTEYLESIPESTTIIFNESEVDTRTKGFKAISKYGYACKFETPTENDIVRWIVSKVKAEGKNISGNTLNLFISMTGLDMSLIESELEKLFSYTLKKDVIETSDVLDIVSGQINNRAFDMVEAIGEKNKKKALDLYYDLLALQESPMRILYLITRELRIIWEATEMSRHRENESAIAKNIGIPSFAVKKYLRMGKNFSQEQLTKGIEEGLQLEEDFKTGKLNDKIAVEMFIIEYSS